MRTHSSVLSNPATVVYPYLSSIVKSEDQP